MASETPAPEHRRLRRAGGVLLTAVVALAGVVALLLFLQGRDRSEVENGGAAASVGQRFTEPGLPAAVRGGPAARPSDAQLLSWIERGNVVLIHDAPAPPPELTALARRLAGPFDPTLAAAGQAVVVAQRAGADGIVALAWRRILRTEDPADPQLDRFASHWLGRAAP